MTRLTLLAAAILVSAIPLAHSEASAAPRGEMKTVQVAIYYDGAASAPAIHATLKRKARAACAPSMRTYGVSFHQRQCALGIVDKAVAKIGRDDLEAYHYAKTGRSVRVLASNE